MTVKSVTRVRELDVRDLMPPEPMHRVLIALDELGSDEQLRVVHHREPFPLYAMLRERGFSHRTTQLADGCFEILIWR